jgi:hypothetical protein
MTLVAYVTGTPTATRRSNTARLQAAFPSTPAINKTDKYDDASVTELQRKLHNGNVIGNPDYAISATGSGFSLDYVGINATTKPHIEGDVKTGAGGLPWTTYTPNIVSPGQGSINARDIAEPPEGSPRSSGAGSVKLPGISSPQIADQQKGGGTPGNLISGQSHSQSK